MSELKCCKLCGSFPTCENKGECCPECQYFDVTDSICLAPDPLKRSIKKPKPIEHIDDDDDDTFLFDDDEEDEDSPISEVNDDLGLDEYDFDDDAGW